MIAFSISIPTVLGILARMTFTAPERFFLKSPANDTFGSKISDINTIAGNNCMVDEI